ncbi:hypothetical protein M405DRAFT_351339 [Rhizopogon salebrosus TDB-379]|nr:hypothetical protein M405DRAFT_351339 [Rhizopogon salebrosus TDB-379]
MYELATIHTGKGLFLFVERQCRGGFRFHALHASAIVDRAICLHVCVRLPRNISVVDRQLIEDARPFGILSESFSLFESFCDILLTPFARTFHRCSCRVEYK